MQIVFLFSALLFIASGALSADVASLGAACTAGDTCTAHGAYCDGKNCKCNDRFVQRGSVCGRLNGQECDAAMCGFAGAICSDGKCACDTAGVGYDAGRDGDSSCSCPTGSTVRSSDSKCAKKLTETCAGDSDCIDNARCTSTTCSCDATRYYTSSGTTSCICDTSKAVVEGGVCKLKAREDCTGGDTCVSNAACSDHDSNANTNDQCTCFENRYYDAAASGLCVCDPTKAVAENGVCKLKAGEDCTGADTCVSNAACTDHDSDANTNDQCTCSTTRYAAGATGLCVCDPTKAVLEDGICKLKAAQDCSSGTDTCVSNAACTDHDSDANTNDQCTCSTTRYYAAGATGQCVCDSTKAVAENGVCKLKATQDCSSGTGTCVSNAACIDHDSDANTNDQCTCSTTGHYAAAASGLCECESTTTDKDGSCLLNNGEQCNAASDCYPHDQRVCATPSGGGANTVCGCNSAQHFTTSGNINCICDTGYTMRTDGTCGAEIGGTCNGDSDCYDTLVCKNTRCACDDTKKLTGTTGISCSCQANYHLSISRQKCVLQLGQNCNTATTSQPCIDDAICDKLTGTCTCNSYDNYEANGLTSCRCKNGFISQNGMCLAKVGGFCAVKATACVSHATCNRNTSDASSIYTCSCTNSALDDGTCKSDASGRVVSLVLMMVTLLVTSRLT